MARSRLEPVTDAGKEYAAFKIEQRGIDLIPDAEKKMKPTGLFWLWAGGVFNVEFLFYGTLIMTFGLSVLQAILAILIGNLTYAFLVFASLQGPKTGRPPSWSPARRSGRTGTVLRSRCSTGEPRSGSRSRASTSSSSPCCCCSRAATPR